jgi:hypothetical protein
MARHPRNENLRRQNYKASVDISQLPVSLRRPVLRAVRFIAHGHDSDLESGSQDRMTYEYSLAGKVVGLWDLVTVFIDNADFKS